MRYFIYFLTVFIVLFFSGCEQKNKKISVAMVTWMGYEPIILAKELGYLDENVFINRTLSSNDALNAFRSDLVDVAFLTLDEVLLLSNEIDDKIKILAVTNVSNGGDVLIVKKNIKSYVNIEVRAMKNSYNRLDHLLTARSG